MSIESYRFPSTLFKGQVALVTGSGSQYGIGRSIVLALVAAGAAVVYASDLNDGNFESLKKAAAAINPNTVVEGRALNVASEDDTTTLLKEIIKAHGRFDLYFPNAGYVDVKNINDVSSTQLSGMLEVMTKGVFYAIKHGSRAMAVTSSTKPYSSGAIVGTTSAAGMNGKFADMAYCTAKAAAIGMIRSASVQLSASNIRVNSVAPGFVATSLVSSSVHARNLELNSTQGTEEEAKEMYFGYRKQQGLTEDYRYYFEKVARPEEMANVAVFLASDLATAINGQTILADYGMTEGTSAHECLGGIPAVTPLEF